MPHLLDMELISTLHFQAILQLVKSVEGRPAVLYLGRQQALRSCSRKQLTLRPVHQATLFVVKAAPDSLGFSLTNSSGRRGQHAPDKP